MRINELENKRQFRCIWLDSQFKEEVCLSKNVVYQMSFYVAQTYIKVVGNITSVIVNN